MTIYFTSDHHFSHANIIKYTNRPFSNPDQMDEVMIARWNETVKPKDIVYHLGDFTLGNQALAMWLFRRLYGNIKVLRYGWHHDRRWIKRIKIGTTWSSMTGTVTVLPPMVVLESKKYSKTEHPLAIVLCHYPLAIWDRRHYGAIHLHGHSHGRHNGIGRIMDVGVDSNDFRPVSLEKVMEKLLPIRDGIL